MFSDYIRYIARRSGLMPLARHAASLVSRPRREANREASARFHAVCRSLPQGFSHALTPPQDKGVVLTLALSNVDHAAQHVLVLAAFRLAGYTPLVIVNARGNRIVENTYRLFGITEFVYSEDGRGAGNHPMTAEISGRVTGVQSALEATYHGIQLGRSSMTLAMRQLRIGDPDFSDPVFRSTFERIVSDSLYEADFALGLMERYRPTMGLIIDHGYPPQSIHFDALRASGCDVVNWLTFYRPQSLILKRVKGTGPVPHPSSLSSESWDTMRADPWSEQHWQELYHEWESRYSNGTWFAHVGTSVGKREIVPDQLRETLAIEPGRKVVGLFPHMVWESAFFWGSDVLDNYEAWFRHVLIVAARTPQVDWVIKLHPAHRVKSVREGASIDTREMEIIRECFGELPTNFKLIPVETKISTWSLLSIIDYCVTVRGTIGIEAASLGIPVITGGTGRYNDRGFTVDPKTVEELTETLEQIDTRPPLSAEETELARRYAYGLFLRRPMELECIQCTYDDSEKVNMRTLFSPSLPANLQDWPDVQRLAEWIESEDADFLYEWSQAQRLLAS